MTAIVTDRKTQKQNMFCGVYSAITHADYIAIYYINEDGTKDSDVFPYKYAEVQILADR